MAAFGTDPDVLQRLDFRLLQNGAVAMYWRRDILDEDVAWFRVHQYALDVFDCSSWETEGIAHDQLAEQLGFPGYYGRNLNAFNDCLGDLAVPDVAGRALVLTRFHVPARAMPSFAAALLDIVTHQARRHLLFGSRLVALVQTDDPHLELPPVGAMSVGWNPREWIASARGN